MNDLKDFDFFSDYSYTYCSSHLEKDGWSRQEWEQAVNLNKKKLKALEIIKKKNVNIGLLKNKECTFEIYNTMMCPLTQEEYNLLKEVFKNE